MKWAWILGSVIGLILVGGYACGKVGKRFREKTLSGPFYGESYKGNLESQWVSKLALSQGSILAVYAETNVLNPVLCRLEKAGSNVWCQVLEPVRKNPEGTFSTNRIEWLKLKSIQKYKEGFKVHVVCDWDGGGQESGIVYLNADFSFRSFGLGW